VLWADADAPDDAELVITTVKLVRNDIFGLEKYLAWGVMVHEKDISGYYLISYYTKKDPSASGYQKVAVSLTNPEFRIKSREGYIFGTEQLH